MPVTDQNKLRGVAFMLAAMVVFALQDGLSKALAADHSPIFITMWRYWAFGAVCLVLLWRNGFRRGLRSGQPVLQATRGVRWRSRSASPSRPSTCSGWRNTHAIFAFGPLLVVALSGPLLGERVGWRRWVGDRRRVSRHDADHPPGSQPLELRHGGRASSAWRCSRSTASRRAGWRAPTRR